jgi:hypothetical protein
MHQRVKALYLDLEISALYSFISRSPSSSTLANMRPHKKKIEEDFFLFGHRRARCNEKCRLSSFPDLRLNRQGRAKKSEGCLFILFQ